MTLASLLSDSDPRSGSPGSRSTHEVHSSNLSASLLFVLLLAKVLSLQGHPIAMGGWALVAYFWQDVVVALLFALLEWNVPRGRILSGLYCLLVLYTSLNVAIARVLSTPLTFRMLRAARGTLSDSIRYYFTARYLLPVILVCLAAAVLPSICRRIGRPVKRLAILALVPVALLGPYATRQTDTLGMHRNALAALVVSAFASLPAVDPGGPGSAPPISDGIAEDLRSMRGMARGKNVVLIALESTAAQYLRVYGAAYDVMPHVTAFAERALVFESAYAVYPESIKGLFALLCSQFPVYARPPEDLATLKVPSLAQELASAHYRTGLFHSGRFMYLGMESIVHGRGFDTLEDAGDIGSDRNSSFGTDERSTVRRILGWIDAQPRERPFLVTYLPVAGHHPYESPTGGPYSEADDFGRYRNVLRYADGAIGDLETGLRERGLADQTLWVLIGDHGEAFGQHDRNYGHTFFLYEENVRVPLIIALPGIMKEKRLVHRVAIAIDVMPTILDLLGRTVPRQCRGSSLLQGPPRMALFFTDYSLGFLGLRDERWKFIHEVDSGRGRLFDLRDDPGELHDLARSHPDRCSRYRDILLRRNFGDNQGR